MSHSFNGDFKGDDEEPGGLADDLLDGAESPAAPAGGLSQRTIAVLTAAGLTLLLVASLGLAALVGSVDDNKPAAVRQTAGPVVPESIPTPSEASAPVTEAAGALPSDTPSPSPSKPPAKTTPATAPKTTAAVRARVVSASISISPNSYDGPCNGAGTVTAHAFVRITISAPNVLVKYNINSGTGGSSTPSGTTFTDDLVLPVTNPHSGVRTFKLNVELPGTASATAAFEINCRNK